MAAMNDRVINVPIEDNDIIKEVKSLPRTEKNSGMVTVGLKRDKSMKNFHKLEMIRPKKVYKALLYLIDNHPNYSKITVQAYEEWEKLYFDSTNAQSDILDEGMETELTQSSVDEISNQS